MMDIKEYESSKKFLKKYYKELRIAAEVVREKYHRSFSDGTEIGEFDLENDMIEITYEQRASRGCWDSDYWNIELPIDIVTSEGLERYIQEKDEKIAKAEKDRAEKNKADKEKKDKLNLEIRRKQYEALTKEFGNSPE